MTYSTLYRRDERPFGNSWEEWAELWCKWFLSIPKLKNPALDISGKNCAVNQTEKNVWFLTGTFGNDSLVKRKCRIPNGRALFFPILVKENSFKEDSDITTELELVSRARHAMDRVIQMEARVDGEEIYQLESYRARSRVFDIGFPRSNVYSVRPGLTRSVCDGYWLFVKPFKAGKHWLYFSGETMLDRLAVNHMTKTKVYKENWRHFADFSTFRTKVLYEITISQMEENI
ncbi:MAG TPA: hypothetical protein VJ729_15295 [Nitrososphaeraceae archaeon]|nr:hypothetical protein [Nitrososphaeraceae archaeon]